MTRDDDGDLAETAHGAAPRPRRGGRGVGARGDPRDGSRKSASISAALA